MKKFSVVAADPPWPFKDKLPGNGRGALKHYDLMTLDEIKDYPAYHWTTIGKRIAPDALLFLWRVASMPEAAIEVCRAWGFEPYGEIIWDKRTATGKQHFGMGRVVRAAHESILIGRRGRPEIQSKSVRSLFSAPVGRHSAKPDEFYALVEELSPGPYLELFAREKRRRWTTIGNEL